MINPTATNLKKAGLKESEVRYVLNNREIARIENRLKEIDRKLAVIQSPQLQAPILAHGMKGDVKRSSRKDASYHGEVNVGKIPGAVAALSKKGVRPSRKAIAAKLGVGYQNLAYCLRTDKKARSIYEQAVQKAA